MIKATVKRDLIESIRGDAGVKQLAAAIATAAGDTERLAIEAALVQRTDNSPQVTDGEA